MNDEQSDAANEQWRQHTEDETIARQAQQRDAGDTHGPVTGPPPYGNAQLNVLAAESTARERERCAHLVETWPVGTDAEAAELLRRVAFELRRHP
jgi:hypothetical protein